MIWRIAFVTLVCSYLALVVPFSQAVSNRPVVVKLGTLPEAEMLRAAAGDQRYLVAQYAVAKVLFYYGTLVEKFKNKVHIPPEYDNMFQTLRTSSKLDPWNADVYYFAQAAFTWELGRGKEVNELLDYGMKYRTWDDQLPFFAGFNAAYFQKDYPAAAAYMKRAAEISGNPLMTNLAARYYHEAGNAEMGLKFVEFMQKRTTDSRLVALYQLRRDALLATLDIQKGVTEYRRRFGKSPERLADLTSTGILGRLPEDPYGGAFYLDPNGQVRSTSKFALAVPKAHPGETNPRQENK